MQKLYKLQEGAPADLFQAVQRYLEYVDTQPARDLIKRRGGRVLALDGQQEAHWRPWLLGLQSEVIGGNRSVMAWSADTFRCEVRGRLRVIQGAEIRERRLQPSEARWQFLTVN